MKGVRWLYLVVYSLFVLLTFALALFTENVSFTLGIQMVFLLVPSYVMALELLSKPNHIALSIIGLIALAPVLAEAHKFNGLSIVTPAMYALFLPMAIYLAINLYRRHSENT
jgi:hypothetical protein